MPRFKFKRLPDGFEFPVTRHEIRDFIKTTTANFEVIEFGGIASSDRYSDKDCRFRLNFVCSAKACFKEYEWYFNLRVEGLRPEHYEERREEISQALLAELRRWIDEKNAQPETAPKKPCRAHIYFDLTEKPKIIAKLSEWS